METEFPTNGDYRGQGGIVSISAVEEDILEFHLFLDRQPGVHPLTIPIAGRPAIRGKSLSNFTSRILIIFIH